jgi:hypothetical protein
MSAAEDRGRSAADTRLPQWLGDPLWERLSRAEADHQRIQTEHENVRRDLESVQRSGSPDLRAAWRRYCEIIAELDRTTAELESLRAQAG